MAERAGEGWKGPFGGGPGGAGPRAGLERDGWGEGRVGTRRVGGGPAGRTGAALAMGTCVLIHNKVRRNRVECQFGAEY